MADIRHYALDRINEVRRWHGLPPLHLHYELSIGAKAHCEHSVDRVEDMVYAQRLEHTPNHLRTGFDAENVHAQIGNMHANDFVNSGIDVWAKHEGHRNNMLSRNFTHTGIDIAMRDGPYGTKKFFMTARFYRR